MVKRKDPDPETSALAARIGRRVRALRRDRGLTQTILAARAGLTRIYIGEFERGVRDNPTLANLRHIADGLGVPVRELFQATDQPGTTDEDDRTIR